MASTTTTTATTATLTSGDPALRRSYSLPARDNSELLLDEAAAAAASGKNHTSSSNHNGNGNGSGNGSGKFGALRHSKSEDIPQQHKLDRYGFILNMDSHGNLQHEHSGAENGYSRNGGGVGGNDTAAAASARNGRGGGRNSADSANPHHLAPHNNSSSSDPQYQRAGGGEEEASLLPTDDAQQSAATTTNQRRVKKWDAMLGRGEDFVHQPRRRKLVKRRLRKGLPDEKRGTVWPVLCRIDQKIQQHPGLYKQLVERSVGRSSTVRDWNSSSNSNSNNNHSNQEENNNNYSNSNSKVASPMSNIEAQIAKPKEAAASNAPQQQHQQQTIAKRANGEPITFEYTKSFKVIQDTIERDIHRTFPRHSMFYTSDNEEYDADLCSDDDETAGGGGALTSFNDENSAIFQTSNLCGDTTDRLRQMMLARSETITSKRSTNSGRSASAPLLRPSRSHLIPTGNANGDAFDPARIFDGAGGQARLRRVLKAYSTYDREIGYCQGMNFIAAMFLTLMPEERAFWMLVSVMYDEPCHMRGLFGEGMRETHKVLFVAEKLIHQFLPRLGKHLDKEMIHVTMYATQWLLTQYTSSFKFDLVTRVWDCFLFEGWKITYRVMLSILQRCQAQLLAMSFEEMLGFFRDLPERPEINASILDDAIKIPLKTSHIVKYEKQYRAQQEQQQQQGSTS